MDKICSNCLFNAGNWCNRMVFPGGFGMHDILADELMRDNTCKFYRHSDTKNYTSKPNFENS